MLKNLTVKTPIGRLRTIGLLEGLSFLLLLGVAMPLKYLANMPLAVKYTGWAHGLLFILYILAVAHVTIVKHWSAGKILLAIVASLLPLGTFILDHRLREEDQINN